MFRRHPQHHRILWRVMLLISLVLGLLTWLGHGDAHAVTPDPAIRCGATVAWRIEPSLGTPASAESAIAAAWEAVAKTTAVRAHEVESGATVAWDWPDAGLGVEQPDREVRDGQRLEIDHSAATEALSAKATRQLVLQDVLTALGVGGPTSTTVLSPRDRSALTAQCAAEAATASPSSSASVSGDASGVPIAPIPSGEQTAPTVGDDEPVAAPPATAPHARWSGAARVAHHITLWAVLALVLALAAWWVAGPHLARSITALRRDRNNTTPDKDVE